MMLSHDVRRLLYYERYTPILRPSASYIFSSSVSTSPSVALCSRCHANGSIFYTYLLLAYGRFCMSRSRNPLAFICSVAFSTSFFVLCSDFSGLPGLMGGAFLAIYRRFVIHLPSLRFLFPSMLGWVSGFADIQGQLVVWWVECVMAMNGLRQNVDIDVDWMLDDFTYPIAS
ncbi:hypothetical protein BCR34DRAFT_122463 [Clohesyomyces aquaticus]|uniref:Uncharacterized protein n=1 Tax=Clohesyomyces aquaticus TaxID=1231657 RepID=A0A1Y1YQP8_9PLEO|nr:hypothetical protein BCR34DRAFT_122463 [Clohesyomyces aquaticus]